MPFFNQPWTGTFPVAGGIDPKSGCFGSFCVRFFVDSSIRFCFWSYLLWTASRFSWFCCDFFGLWLHRSVQQWFNFCSKCSTIRFPGKFELDQRRTGSPEAFLQSHVPFAGDSEKSAGRCSCWHFCPSPRSFRHARQFANDSATKSVPQYWGRSIRKQKQLQLLLLGQSNRNSSCSKQWRRQQTTKDQTKRADSRGLLFQSIQFAVHEQSQCSWRRTCPKDDDAASISRGPKVLFPANTPASLGHAEASLFTYSCPFRTIITAWQFVSIIARFL